jgi:hypothetical protein
LNGALQWIVDAKPRHSRSTAIRHDLCDFPLMDAPHYSIPKAAPSGAEPGPATRPAVLIVEDERVARRALSTLLAAYRFDTAAAESAEGRWRSCGTSKSRRNAAWPWSISTCRA